jgi:hypothetical protein
VLFLGGFGLAEELRGRPLFLAMIALAVVSTFPSTLAMVLQRTETEASYQRERLQPQWAKRYFAEHGISDPYLLIDPGHYFLFKPVFQHVYNISYLDSGLNESEPTNRFQGLALCYMATPAFSREQLAWPKILNRTEWELIQDGEDSQKIRLFGKTLMHRNWSWSCDLYRRVAGVTLDGPEAQTDKNWQARNGPGGAVSPAVLN